MSLSEFTSTRSSKGKGIEAIGEQGKGGEKIMRGGGQSGGGGGNGGGASAGGGGARGICWLRYSSVSSGDRSSQDGGGMGGGGSV